jgi:hypothetical protein
MANVRVKWNGAMIKKTADRSIDDALYAGASFLLKATLPRVPKRTGRLASSGYAASATKSSYHKGTGRQKREVRPRHGEGAVAFASMLAHLVEAGARPHTIKPRRKRFLVFGGRYAKAVQHPGTKGRRFLRKGWRAEKNRVGEIVAKGVKQEFDKLP